MKTLKGNLSITRPHYSDGTKLIHINLTDESSGCQVVEIRLSPEQFAEVLVGSSQRGCEFDFNDSGVIGKIREYKEEIVPRPKKYKDKEEVAEILKPFEIDGWKGHKEDVTNSHLWVGTGNVMVGFHRYVEKVENKD